MAGDLHRTATTTYPCCLPALGGFSGSWSCKTCRCKCRKMLHIELKNFEFRSKIFLSFVLYFNIQHPIFHIQHSYGAPSPFLPVSELTCVTPTSSSARPAKAL
jgi:hypothetical protein